MMINGENLTFAEFAFANKVRCESGKGFKKNLDKWSVSDWFLAVGGELGEAMNAAKKLNRIRDGIPGNDPSDTEESLLAQVREEIADTFIYLDLTASRLGFRLGDAVIEKFDAKSEEIGYPARLADGKLAEGMETHEMMPQNGVLFVPLVGHQMLTWGWEVVGAGVLSSATAHTTPESAREFVDGMYSTSADGPRDPAMPIRYVSFCTTRAYDTLDKNWRSMHDAALGAIRNAVGLPEASVPQIINAIVAKDIATTSLVARINGLEETIAKPMRTEAAPEEFHPDGQ